MIAAAGLRRTAPLALAVALLGAASSAAFAQTFPPLTGRIVDEANLLSPQTEAALTERLAAFERDTKRQVVVATLRSLQGYPIEDYGYRLGRAWGIGEKDKNTGALLVVAPQERSVRIEVGYGLEGELTDALSSQIIQQTILPAFRAGEFERGIVAGTEAILGALGWKEAMLRPTPRPAAPPGGADWAGLVMFGLFALIWVIQLRRRRRMWRAGRLGGFPIAMGGFGGSRGGGFGGGGFRGGGGSFGGGGASGRW